MQMVYLSSGARKGCKALSMPEPWLLLAWACILGIAISVVAAPDMDPRLGWFLHVLFAVLALAPDGPLGKG